MSTLSGKVLLALALAGVAGGTVAGTSILSRATPPSGTSPAHAPALVAPGVLSTGDYEIGSAVTPDGRTLYFTKADPDFRGGYTILVSRRGDDDGWGAPEVAPFSGRWGDLDPYLSPDGRRLFFVSERPAPQDSAPGTWRIWWTERTDTGGWSDPVPAGPRVHSVSGASYPAVDGEGNLWFFGRGEGGLGGTDLWRAPPDGDSWGEPVNLGPPVNTEHSETNLAVAPDGNWIIFAARRPDGLGDYDLWYAERADEGWTEPVNLSEGVNTRWREFTPFITADGRWLYFASTRRREARAGMGDPWEDDAPIGRTELERWLRSPGNGLGDLYRIPMSDLDLGRER